MTDDRLIEVRAAIHLPGLPVGAVALVDPDEPYVARCLAAGYVVPSGTAWQAADPRGIVPSTNDDEEGNMGAPKFGDHVLFNGEAGEDQFGHVVAVDADGNADILYKKTGGGMELAESVPYRGADDRARDGGGHTFHNHGD